MNLNLSLGAGEIAEDRKKYLDIYLSRKFMPAWGVFFQVSPLEKTLPILGILKECNSFL